jgi:hypothetical protein
LIKGINAQPIEKLGPGYMLAARGALGILFAQVLDRLIEAVPDKRVRLAVKPGIFLVDEIDNFVKIQILHR